VPRFVGSALHSGILKTVRFGARRGRNRTTGDVSSAELYDPATGLWSATGSLATARYLHADAALLRQGAGRGRTR
jgi:hypothetical protein